MEKRIIAGGVPETGGPFNLCVGYGNLIFVSGLPPFDEAYSTALREARATGRPIPPFPDVSFDRQVRTVMDHMKALVEAAGSNMDCLLKVIVWLKDQAKQEEFDRIYRTYFAAKKPCLRARECRREGHRWTVRLRWRLSRMCRAREKAACFRPSSMLATRNHSLNPDVSPAALTHRPLGAG